MPDHPILAGQPGLSTVSHNRAIWGLVGIGVAMSALMLAASPLRAWGGDLPFNAISLTQGVLVMLSVPLATRSPPRAALLVILLFAVVMRAVPPFDYPYLSTDAFRYVWDGRVQGQGINPYRYIPAAPELSFLRDDYIYANINRADYAVTIYPPAAQMLFFLVGRVGDSLTSLRLWFIALEGVTVWLLLDLLRRIGQPVQRIVAYGWHPLTIWEIAGSAHIDGPMVTMAVLGIWLMAALRRPLAAAAAIAVAALMKPLAALALPFVWHRWDWRTPAVAVSVAALLYLPYISVGTGMFAFAGGYAREESLTTGDAFWLAWLARVLFEAAEWPTAWIVPAYLAASATLLAFMALRLGFTDRDDMPLRLWRLGWLVFASLFVLSSGYPWYNLILVPFVVLFGTPAFWAATVAGFLLYDVIANDAYVSLPLRDALYNTAMLLGVLHALWRGRPTRA